MLTAALLAFAVVGGTPLPVVAMMALGIAHPGLGVLPLVAAGSLAKLQQRRGRPRAEDEATYHAAVAAELRSGASLRSALAHAAARTPSLVPPALARRFRLGHPMGRLVPQLAVTFPATGRLLAAAVTVAAAAGGRAAAVFDRLALRAADEAAIARERRTATAQARLSAWIVGGLPVGAVAFAAATGRLLALLAVGPLGVAVVVAGVGFVVAGVVTVVLLVRGRA